MKRKAIFTLSILIIVFSLWGASAKRPLTFQDIMKFKEIHDAAISEDGKWVIYNAQPGRGDGETIVYRVDTGRYFTLARAEKPVISKDGRWVAAAVKPGALEWEQAGEKEKKDLKPGLVLLETATGKQTTFEKVKQYSFSGDSRWLVYTLHPEDKKKENKENAGEKSKEETKKEKKEAKKEDKWLKKRSPLVVRNLETGREFHFEAVTESALDPESRYLAVAIYNPEGGKNGLFTFGLTGASPEEKNIHQEPGARYNNLAWSKKKSMLVFLTHKDDVKKAGNTESGLYTWDGLKSDLRPAVLQKDIPAGWMIPAENQVTWAKDGRRFFFGFKPHDEYLFYKELEKEEEKPGKLKEEDLYDPERLLEKRQVDVWHWLDPLINPQQKKMWQRNQKRTYTAVYHLKQRRFIQLADTRVNRVDPVENPDFALGYSDTPYMRELTWNGYYRDVYLVNLATGTQERILTHHQGAVSLSPGGKYLAYYLDKHWFLYDTRTGKTRNLTAAVPTPFYDEDHDYPEQAPSYGPAGWLEGDRSFLVYDKFDTWQFDTASGKALNLTGGTGRGEKIAFRIRKTDPERKFFNKDEELLLSAHHHEEKTTHFYRARVGKAGVEQLTGGNKKFSFLAKAKKAGHMLYTRESFEEFPDLWVGDPGFKVTGKVSLVNPQIDHFIWGKPRLVEWNSLDGIRLQGVAILPGNYDPQKRYPVLVYYYRFFSQRMYDFNQMVVNHRPNFPFYCSNGYVMFLPDVRFEVGRPGFSATRCVVPGVQKLIDLGIADPRAVALHGHSWSGYQTAFVITQTDIFAAAIAGAPVSNMTSAYSGIRWGSGMARQFQYEKSQSRIGKSLWEGRDLYIENSPVFYADRVDTPLLIEHGDADEAVPWYQSIEFYLAMRRLSKNCIFLQYNDEPHHLKKFSNKLDYSIKMKEFLDHYLKGMPAPDWIKQGVPYRKK